MDDTATDPIQPVDVISTIPSKTRPDLSVKEAYETGWKDKVRARIKRSDGVIVLVSKNSALSTGQKWEIACAKEEKKPIRGIYAYKDDRANIVGVNTKTWSDVNIVDFIDSL